LKHSIPLWLDEKIGTCGRMLGHKVIRVMKVYPIPSGIANPQWGSYPKGGGKLFLGKGGAIWVRLPGAGPL